MCEGVCHNVCVKEGVCVYLRGVRMSMFVCVGVSEDVNRIEHQKEFTWLCQCLAVSPLFVAAILPSTSYFCDMTWIFFICKHDHSQMKIAVESLYISTLSISSVVLSTTHASQTCLYDVSVIQTHIILKTSMTLGPNLQTPTARTIDVVLSTLFQFPTSNDDDNNDNDYDNVDDD